MTSKNEIHWQEKHLNKSQKTGNNNQPSKYFYIHSKKWTVEFTYQTGSTNWATYTLGLMQ